MERPIVNVVATGTTRDYDVQYNTKVLKANIPFDEQVTDENTKYIIRWNFDLGGFTLNDVTIGSEHSAVYYSHTYYYTAVALPAGKALRIIDKDNCYIISSDFNHLYDLEYAEFDKTVLIVSETPGTYEDAYAVMDFVKVPDNCHLQFEGGSISGGLLIGNDCTINYDAGYNIFNDCIIKDFNLPYIDPKWCGAVESTKDSKVDASAAFKRVLDNIMYYCYGTPISIIGRYYIAETITTVLPLNMFGYSYPCNQSREVRDISGTEREPASIIEVAENITAFRLLGNPNRTYKDRSHTNIHIERLCLIGTNKNSIFCEHLASGAPSRPALIHCVEARQFDKVLYVSEAENADQDNPGTYLAQLTVSNCLMYDNNYSIYCDSPRGRSTMTNVAVRDSNLEQGARIYLERLFGNNIIDNCLIEGQDNAIDIEANGPLTFSNNYMEGVTGNLCLCASASHQFNYYNNYREVFDVLYIRFFSINRFEFKGNYKKIRIHNVTLGNELLCRFNVWNLQGLAWRGTDRKCSFLIHKDCLPLVHSKDYISKSFYQSVIASTYYRDDILTDIEVGGNKFCVFPVEGDHFDYTVDREIVIDEHCFVLISVYTSSTGYWTLFDTSYRQYGGRIEGSGFRTYIFEIDRSEEETLYQGFILRYTPDNAGTVFSKPTISIVKDSELNSVSLNETCFIICDYAEPRMYGQSFQRPKFNERKFNISGVGFKYYDTTINKLIVAKSVTEEKVDWVDSDGFTATKSIGSTSERPKGIAAGDELSVLDPTRDIGFRFYDTTLQHEIYVKSIDSETGVVDWRDYDDAVAGIKRYINWNNVSALSASDKYAGLRLLCTNKRSPESGLSGIEIIWNGTNWIDALGRIVDDDYPAKYKGAFTDKPTLSSGQKGWQYFDTTNYRYIIWNGTQWVNSLGESVE